jgi:hypothetical protein
VLAASGFRMALIRTGSTFDEAVMLEGGVSVKA